MDGPADRGEVFNSATHLAGSVFALVGLIALLAAAIPSGSPRKIVGFAVYGVALVELYVVSTVYHAVKGPLKRVFRRLDHTSIYVLIAGTYTPFALLPLEGPGGLVLLGTVWTLAAAGIAQEFLLPRRIEVLSVSLYLLMGWLALAVFMPLRRALGWNAMLCLLAGGVLYTVGVYFYFLDEKRAHSHGIFHLFVLGGSVLHFLVVLFFVS